MKIAKKMINMMVLAASAVILQCCSADDPINDGFAASDNPDEKTAGHGSDNTNGKTVGSGSDELTTFDVAIDRLTAEPQTTASAVYPDEEDGIANNTFDTEVNIVFNGNSVTADAVSGISIAADGAHVVADHGDTKGVRYVVSGTTNAGSLTVVGNKKYAVELSGASITNPDSTALNLLSKKRAYLLLAKGTSSSLADGTVSKATDQKGALYCKGKLLVSGSGQLDVYGNYNNAIHSADYVVFDEGVNVYVNSSTGHGVKANDGVYINGGILNIEVSAPGSKGINSESNITVNGGRTTIVTTGTCAYEDGDATSAVAVKCDSTFTMNDGQLLLKSTGAGGKGLKADWEAYINGGSLYVITTGRSLSYNGDSNSPKGIKVGTKGEHGLLNISGGTVMVRTSGTGGEGIESKGTITIGEGATVKVSAYDDAINAAGDIYLQGGDVTAIGTQNDGIDSNGNMYISGGSIVAFGAGGAESGIDTSEQSRLYVTGGLLFAIGGRIDATCTATNDAQPYASTTGSLQAGATVTLSSGSTTLATFAMPPYSYANGTIMVSAPGMQSGSSYTLNLGSTQLTVTATTSGSTGAMGGMGGMGGNMPGGRW